MKARLKFTKTGSMKFIGHLDVMRYFQKAFRRSGIDIAYSQGFSPHQILSFAAPLGVGLTSDGEYLDMQLHSCDQSPDEMTALLNRQMNEEIRITGFLPLADDTKPSMALVAAADYMIALKPDKTAPAGLAESLEEFLAQETIVVEKETKRSKTEMDIRPFIYRWSLEPFADLSSSVAEYMDSPVKLFLRLATGSVTNLKPDLVMEHLCRYCGAEYHKYDWQVHRLEVYGEAGSGSETRFLPLSELGAERL